MSACRHKYRIELSGKGWCAECYTHGSASRQAEIDELSDTLNTRAERAEASLVDSEARRKGLVAGYNAAIDRVVRLEDALAVAVDVLKNRPEGDELWIEPYDDDEYGYPTPGHVSGRWEAWDHSAHGALAEIEAIKKGGAT